MNKNTEELFLDRIPIEIASLIRDAEREFQNMNAGTAHDILYSLVINDHPAALYYSSGWSHPGEDESEFTSRFLRELEVSANLGYPPAIHKLAVCYDSGDFVNMNRMKAADLFKMAAQLGHPHSQWIHGLNLLYGANGVPQDEESGMDFIRRAFDSRFGGAIVSMAEFYKVGKFGLPLDVEKYQRLMALSETDQVLRY